MDIQYYELLLQLNKVNIVIFFSLPRVLLFYRDFFDGY